MIRLARHHDLARLQSIEVAAGEAFRTLGMDRIADDDPPSIAELEPYLDGGRAWVADEDGTVTGYLIASIVGDEAHIDQVSVHSDFARRGIGAALIEELERWARSQELSGLSLTTYRDVTWNAPYYARLGFHVVPDADLTDALRANRAHEADLGLDEWPRVVMTRDISLYRQP